MDYSKRIAPSTYAILERCSDTELRQIGIIGRAIMMEKPITLDHITRIDSEVFGLIQKYNSKPEKIVAVAKPVVVEDKITPAVKKHCAEVDNAIDEYITDNKDFSMKGYLATNNVNAQIAKGIAAKYQGLESELREAIDGKDAQLKEAYSYLGKVKLKRFYAMVQQIIADCAQQVVTVKVSKPRVQKEKPPAVLASKMKYKKQFEELNLTSEKPEKIIGADTVWIYDTARRKITVYIADQSQKLSIRGTVITGFSVAESGTKTLRKPDAFLAGSLAKRAILQSFKDVKTKPAVPNGRVNDDCIILKVYS
jgi:hypothetical protein